jgi:type IV pilus assembly protein PilQ
MGNEANHFQGRLAALVILLGIGALLCSGCATPTTQQVAQEESTAPMVESLEVRSSPGETVIEIVNSEPTPYTAIGLIDPPRVVVEIKGEPSRDLPLTTMVNDENITEIRLQTSNVETMTTRMEIALAGTVDYKAVPQGNNLVLTFTSKEAPKTARVSEPAEVTEPRISPPEPRIFFEPKPNKNNQVLGVDFAMLDGGRSLLVVTTDKKVGYDLRRKGPKELELSLEESTIPPLLMRRLDSQYFDGAVDRVKASVTDSRVVLDISLRDMVPFHVKQTDAGISVDFEATPIKPPVKILKPVQVAEPAQVQTSPKPPPTNAPLQLASMQMTAPTAAGIPSATSTGMPQAPPKIYTGEPMSFDFVNAEVSNIVRMINAVTDVNIISDPAIAGEKISLTVNNVPWDQVLDIILMTKNLGKRQIAPNILMITTAEKLAQIEAEERRKVQEAQALVDAERKRALEEIEKEKDLEPLITEYMHLDFTMASDLTPHIQPLLSDRGSISEYKAHTIIIRDIAAGIEAAKRIKKEFDIPVKQIMIEARIVDATSSFGRDLGVQWTATRYWQKDSDTDFGLDPTQYENNSDMVMYGQIATNPPTNWSSNITASVARLTNRGLGTVSLDAYLALAETEGTAKVMSFPKVITSNGESASIKRGTTFYLGAAWNVEPKEVVATLSLDVTPTVSYNDFVTMDVAVKDESQTGDSSKSGKDLKTKLMVKSGETAVIGGIYSEDMKENEGGLPGLRKIPYLGWLFKAKSKTVQRGELLIFITPTVLAPPDRPEGSL